MWQRASSSSSSASSLRTSGTQHLSVSSSGTTHSNLITSHQANTMGIRNVGILGIEKRLAEQHQRTHEHISEVFLVLKINWNRKLLKFGFRNGS